MTTILLAITLVGNLATLCILWSTGRKLRRVDEDLDTLERAVFGIEGDLANLQGGRQP